MAKRSTDSFSMGGTFANVVRKTTTLYFVLAPFTLIYLAFALSIAWNTQPVSQFFGMPKNHAESILLDLIFAVLPLIIVIAVYLVRLKRSKSAQRAAFLADFKGREVVQSSVNPNLIYAVVERGPNAGRIAKMQVVWAADGRIQHGDIYENMAEIGTRPFDSERFLND